MTVDEAVKQLEDLIDTNVRINAKIKEMEYYRDLACRVTQVLSDMPKVNAYGDRVGDNVSKIADINIEINKEVDALVNKRREVNKTISAIKDSRYRSVLELVYVNGMRVEEVADIMHYDRKYIYTLRENAIEEFEKVLNIRQKKTESD